MGPERALHRRLAAQPIAPLAQTALRWAARLRAAQRRQVGNSCLVFHVILASYTFRKQLSFPLSL